MLKSIKILGFLFLLLVMGSTAYGQAVTDTLRIQKRTETNRNSQSQGENGQAKIQERAQGNNQGAGKNQGVKRVTGARPDMSKARGARPPSIVRPSGSGIPRGIGKPGGVGKRGGR